MTTLSIQIGQYSIAGRKPENEDFHGALVPKGSSLKYKGIAIAIADGISGSDAGKEASECCVANFLGDYYSTPTSWSVKQSAGKVLTALNTWLYSQGQRDPLMAKGLVSTLSILVFKSHTAHIFHVGDSRIYRLRGSTFEQLTNDHRYYTNATNHYLTRAMGADLHLDLDYSRLPVEEGDIYILTTDGVHDYLTDAQIRENVEAQELELDGAAKRIVDHAYANNSHDNITCQVVRVDSLELENADEAFERLKQLAFPPVLEVGMKLDGYEIIKELYASTRSQLYLARDKENGDLVSIKTPSVNFEDQPAYIERFIFEEWVGRRIDNAHVLRVLEAPNDRKFLYYVTEYIDGVTLAKWIEKHPSPDICVVISIVEQIVKGLRAFHRKETLHQDLKPDNIMINDENVVKLIDFGSVRIAGVQDTYSVFDRDMLLGTEQYTAPEYMQSSGIGIQSDLFSLGVIVYELLTGQHPYGPNASTKNLFKRQYIPASRHHKMVPPWLDGAIRKAVQQDPRLRYEGLSEFLFDLQHPNPRFAEYSKQPLVQRNPVKFWQLIFGVSLLTNLYLVYLLMNA